MSKITEIQTILGVVADDKWGPKSQSALDSLIHPAAVPVSADQSDTFKAFMPFILEWEGTVFENDPDDPGGATKFGIDQRSHPGVNIRQLTEEGATAIYWEEWVDAGCGSMPSPYAEVYFNCRVNMGTGRAKEFHAIAKGNADTFLDLQEAKYRSIASHGTMGKFLKGWLNRTNALRKRFGI
jgi:lysozyme family protein